MIKTPHLRAWVPFLVGELRSKHEYWSGLVFPPPGDLPNPEIEPLSPTLQADSLPLCRLGSPCCHHWTPLSIFAGPSYLLLPLEGRCHHLEINLCAITLEINQSFCRRSQVLAPWNIGLPWRLVGKESTCNAGASGLIPGSERSPGGGHGNSPQYSCLENPMDRGAWRATIHRVTKSRVRLKWLSPHARTMKYQVATVWGLIE